MIQLRFLLLRSISSESSLTQARPLAGGTEGGVGAHRSCFQAIDHVLGRADRARVSCITRLSLEFRVAA